ncbi:MAG TPA: hypothetical protein PK071_00015 [Atopobiaceae bacterium]|nr:hypothetical protein [Atopobiaceae bacterium]
MKTLSSVKSSLHLLSVSVLALLIAGCASLQPSADTAGNTPDVDVLSEEYVWEHGYSTNAAGQTYGPLMPDDYYGSDAEYDRDDMPDLLLVTSNEGPVGYVYWDELFGSEPGSIEEALEGSSRGPRDLPVYTEDGTTVIGTFTVQ